MRALYEKLNQLLLNPNEITDNRMSIINGIDDLTQYSSYIINDPNEFINVYGNNRWNGTCDVSECIAKIILAEIYYQKDDCYNSLVMINSALACLDRKKHIEVWVVARYVQLCIMIVTGQLKVIYPLVESMREDVMDSGNRQLIDNYEALGIWCALYDDKWDVVDAWIDNNAPNEFDTVEQKDVFCLFVKARVYYVQGKYFALVTLLQQIENILKTNNHVMDLCEMYMLMAMALYAEGHKNEAFGYLEKIVEECSERGFVRLFADEGEPMYRMIREYLEKNSVSEEKYISFYKKVRKSSKNMALEFPSYLKNQRFEQFKLTKREHEVMNLLMNRRTNSDIADFLGCSVNTVKYHLKNIFKKLGVDNRKEAIEIVSKFN